MEEIAPMVVAVVLILTTGAVALLRPLTKRLGALLELREKQARGEIESPQLQRVELLLESMSARLELLEERQDFTDQLMRARDPEPRQLPSTEKKSWE